MCVLINCTFPTVQEKRCEQKAEEGRERSGWFETGIGTWWTQNSNWRALSETSDQPRYGKHYVDMYWLLISFIFFYFYFYPFYVRGPVIVDLNLFSILYVIIKLFYISCSHVGFGRYLRKYLYKIP